MTTNPPTNGGGGLRGTAPTTFTGDRSKSDAFLSKFRRYRLLNRNNDAMSNLFNRVLTALSYIRGPIVDDWVSAQDRKLERCLLAANHVDYVSDTTEQLWTDFETAFKTAWKDSERTQSVYEQLMKLTMKEYDVDLYTATFERLALAAGWEPNAQGTIKQYRRGLRDNIHRRIINRDQEPVTMIDWVEAARAEVHKVRRTLAAGLDFRNKNKPRDPSPFQTGQTQRANAPRNSNPGIVPMEVDTAATTPQLPFKKLTDEERVQYRKEGRCFRCRQKGHMARECAGRRPQSSSPTPSTISARSTSDSTTAVDVAPDDSVSNVPTACVTTVAPKLTRAQQIVKIEEEMDDEEQSAYLDARDMDSDFYGVGQ